MAESHEVNQSVVVLNLQPPSYGATMLAFMQIRIYLCTFCFLTQSVLISLTT